MTNFGKLKRLKQSYKITKLFLKKPQKYTNKLKLKIRECHFVYLHNFSTFNFLKIPQEQNELRENFKRKNSD